MLHGNLRFYCIHIGAFFIINIHIRHSIPVKPYYLDRPVFGIHRRQKHGVRLSSIRSLCHFLCIAVFINAHKQECHHLFVISIDSSVMLYPAFLPCLLFFFSQNLSCCDRAQIRRRSRGFAMQAIFARHSRQTKRSKHNCHK